MDGDTSVRRHLTPVDPHAKAPRRFTVARDPSAPLSAMSTASPEPRPSTVECRNPACDDHGPRWEYIEGEFCSHHCRIEARGHKALAPIRHDHRYCFTCGSQLKRVYRPTERGRGLANARAAKLQVYTKPPDVLDGWQSRTPEATVGEKSHGDHVTTGTVCRTCGNTTPNQLTAELFAADPEGYAHRLLDVLEREAETTVDRERFEEAFDGERLAYAVGQSVEDG